MTMKQRLWISRIIFFVLIPGIFVFALLVSSSLKQDILSLPSAELIGFRRTVNGGVADMLRRRDSALNVIAGREPITEIPSTQSSLSYGYPFNTARDRMNAAMVSGWIDEGSMDNPGYMELSNELDSVLDSADELYEQYVARRTASLEEYLTESAVSRCDDYIRFSGYRKLFNTMGRDLIKYKNFNSLEFHEYKTEYYRTQMLAAEAELDVAAALVETREAEIETSIRDNYSHNILELSQGYFEILTGQSHLVVDINRDLIILDQISNRIADLDEREFQLLTSVRTAGMPAINREVTIDLEREFNKRIAVITGL